MIFEEFLVTHNLTCGDVPVELITWNYRKIEGVSDFMKEGYSINQSMELVNISDKYNIEYGTFIGILYKYRFKK